MVWITAFFTENSSPKTGLSPTLTSYRVSDNALILNAIGMIEIGSGYYKYNFAAYDEDEEYIYVADGGVILSGAERYKYGGSAEADIKTIMDDVNDILVDTSTTLPTTLTTIEGKIDTIDGIVDDILIDTSTTIPASITTIDGEISIIDGIVDDILEDTSTTIPAALTIIDNEIAVIDGEVGVIDGIVDSILIDTETTLPATLTGIENKIDLIDTNVDTLLVDVAAIPTDHLELEALMGKNSVYEHVFDADHNHTGFIQYCYDSLVNKQAHDKATGLLYRFKFDVDYTGTNPTVTKKELMA
ncbi:MAG: hypothetical protein GY853_16700 [PVC group bacterium]|nr:hypothetical protein [PVC group bacterium]